MLFKVRMLTQKSSSPHQPATPGLQLRNGIGDDHDPAAQILDAAQHQYGQRDSNSPSTPRIVNGSAHFHNADNGLVALSHYPSPLNSNGHFNSSESQFHSQQSAAPTATMSPAVTAKTNVPVFKPGETRIDRVEKELRDHKNMLAQILGAVQEIRGSPGSESRV